MVYNNFPNINTIARASLTDARTAISSAYIVYRKPSIIANKSKTQILSRPHLSRFVLFRSSPQSYTHTHTHTDECIVSNVVRLQTIEPFSIVIPSAAFFRHSIKGKAKPVAQLITLFCELFSVPSESIITVQCIPLRSTLHLSATPIHHIDRLIHETMHHLPVQCTSSSILTKMFIGCAIVYVEIFIHFFPTKLVFVCLSILPKSWHIFLLAASRKLLPCIAWCSSFFLLVCTSIQILSQIETQMH